MATRRAQIVFGLLLSLGAGLLPLGTWGGKTGLLGPLASIGFCAFGAVARIAGVIAGILLVAGIVVVYSFVFPWLHLKVNTGEMGKLLATPFWYRFALVTRAAVAEELLFRGYPLERIAEVGGRRWAAVVSWTAFTYAHLSSWGWAQLIVAGCGG